MFTMALAMFTLLDSRVPDLTIVEASASAGVPSVVWYRPSAPWVMLPVGGFTSLMRPTIALVCAVWPSGTIDTVPSEAMPMEL